MDTNYTRVMMSDAYNPQRHLLAVSNSLPLDLIEGSAAYLGYIDL